jgi:Arc/MetJ-type ribon-helix-helix transcriptional regulator
MVGKNHVSVRLDPPTLARVDALIPQVSVGRRSATRSDVLRALIVRALESGEPLKSTELPEIDADISVRRAPKCAG